jgi:hypothetical protein
MVRNMFDVSCPHLLVAARKSKQSFYAVLREMKKRAMERAMERASKRTIERVKDHDDNNDGNDP